MGWNVRGGAYKGSKREIIGQSTEKSKINNKIPTLFWIILTNFISSSFSTMLGILYIFETLKKVPKVEK